MEVQLIQPEGTKLSGTEDDRCTDDSSRQKDKGGSKDLSIQGWQRQLDNPYKRTDSQPSGRWRDGQSRQDEDNQKLDDDEQKRREHQDTKNTILVKQLGMVNHSHIARDVDSSIIQDEIEMVIVGADVEALYMSLTDLEVALICYDAVMKSKIRFKNVD